MKIVYDYVPEPVPYTNYIPVDLTAKTMNEHENRVMDRLAHSEYDAILIYADREHGANFAYLTGFEPRFEEAALVLHKNGDKFILLGNENLKMHNYSFVSAKLIHVPYFSLPYQPMLPDKPMSNFMEQAGIHKGMKIGCVGWKHFTGNNAGNFTMMDIPAFIVDAVRVLVGKQNVKNASRLFLDSEYGVRHIMNANEISHYEFASGLASSKVFEAMNAVKPGISEMEVASYLNTCGQPISVTTIVAAGERFTNAVVFPRNKKMEKGEKCSITLGLRGGLSSRASFIAENVNDLPKDQKEYITKVVSPYYRAVSAWYSEVGIGVNCGDLYKMVEQLLPKEKYHWSLNPGHYTDNEEWSASPFYENSKVILKSGMILQMDIIPAVPGYAGVGAEDGIAIADEGLRTEIKRHYPQTWKRFMKRRDYMTNILGIRLRDEILPMSDICGYLRPYLLKHDMAMKVIEI